MNATLHAQNAYRMKSQPIRTDRDTEYDAFARITSRLKSAASRSPAGFKELAAAIHDNRRLWTLLASDVASRENALPEALRERILYLSEFTRVHSSKVLRREANADALVEINTAIMKGLRQKAAAPKPVTTEKPVLERR